MYDSLVLPWSTQPLPAESVYRDVGLVKTKGTLFLLPPSDDILRETFNAPPRSQTRMSSGAVALCKHFERGGASSEHDRPHPFWTLPTGSNEHKTEVASEILDGMLAQAVRKNVMLLHQGVAVYEIRNSSGYGMRWTLDITENHHTNNKQGQVVDDTEDWVITRTTFRGFLEPIVGMDHELPQGKQETQSVGCPT